jgi:hypothetical protein
MLHLHETESRDNVLQRSEAGTAGGKRNFSRVHFTFQTAKLIFLPMFASSIFTISIEYCPRGTLNKN